MARPSLTPNSSGLAVARQALSQQGLTQVELVRELECSRQPISNFFGGKAIEQRLFMAICQRLGLDWHEIAQTPPTGSRSIATTRSKDTQALVNHYRHLVHAEIAHRCGPIRILGLNHPIEPEDIYTEVKVLEKISADRWQTIDDSMAETQIDDRWSLGKVNVTRISGINALTKYQHLILFGKPGAGKTTFLQHLATECDRGNIAADRVPILLTLKDWAQTDADTALVAYIDRRYGSGTNINEWRQLFQAGRGLILLDGWDEIPRADEAQILDRLREFIKEFGDNYIAISCRIGAWEDTYGFERFTEVELADFDDEQIAKFASKWFQDRPHGAEFAANFLQELARNPELKDLVVTPILLPLVCLAFEDLGSCLHIRTRLYQVGIETLLAKWDNRRGIERDPIYRWLSPELKIQLLATIAFKTLQERQYFFSGAVVEQYILEFLQQLPDIDPRSISPIASRSILKAIVAQHGLLIERARDIYSFSHLTFHEYFVACYLIPTPTQTPPPASIEILLAHLDDGSTWREVWLLAVELLSHGDLLLQPLQQHIHELVRTHPDLGDYLRQLPQIAPELDLMLTNLSPQAVLALRFDIDFDLDRHRTVAFALDPRSSIFVAASFYHRMLGIDLKTAIDRAEADPQISIAKTANEAMRIAIENVLEDRKLAIENYQKLESLKKNYERENDLVSHEEVLNKMATDARIIARSLLRLGDSSQKSEDFKLILKKYYVRISIIVECLQNRDCQISQVERNKLMKFLFKS
ncbi:NACHT domain-containing protein [Chamaesiphon sp.]|uniref:NACHT domain-containing protein n=1 Tax=Chamaesiphon sp. TaxID=2814140 RepID=UPI0035948F35